jgi:uncharacterized protein
MGAASPLPRRFRSLPRAVVLCVEVPVATTFVSRLFGLALLSRERAGPGLLIPHCRSVHTFGMRFAIHLLLLDSESRLIRAQGSVAPCRLIDCRQASAVLELREELGAGAA